MNLGNLEPTSSSDDWNRKWADIFDRYQNDLRHAYYVRALLEPEEIRLLEIGAGSFRDMTELRRHGLDCEGMDFSSESVLRAQSKSPNLAPFMHQMSAFSMPFADRSFDVTYHNGFWALFSDQQIGVLAREQARITRNRMFATVHNAHNRQFVDYFDRMKANDPLYDIRFFTVDEVSSLLRRVCSRVTVVPVGKGKQFHEDLLIKNGVTDPASIRSCLMDAGLSLLESSERLMCIGVVD